MPVAPTDAAPRSLYETEAARIIRRVGSLAETAKDLAYRLFVISDRKG